jgi:hypothetical protein
MSITVFTKLATDPYAEHSAVGLHPPLKAIPVTGCGDPYGCETSRLPHFLDSRLKDGVDVVSLTRRQAALYPQEDPWYSFLFEAESISEP